MIVGPQDRFWDQGETEIHFFRKDFTSFYGFSGMSTVNKDKKANMYQIHPPKYTQAVSKNFEKNENRFFYPKST